LPNTSIIQVYSVLSLQSSNQKSTMRCLKLTSRFRFNWNRHNRLPTKNRKDWIQRLRG